MFATEPRLAETTETWLHKLRRAMVRPGRDRLNGIVEVRSGNRRDGGDGPHGRLERLRRAQGRRLHAGVSVISVGSYPAHEAMARTVASLLKRGLLGTLQGGIQNLHLDYYLDEFTFGFNRRRSWARGLLFHRFVEQAMAIGPAPYRAITGKPADTNDSAGYVSEGDTQYG